MKTFYRYIVNHSHYLVLTAILAPLCSGGLAWSMGSPVIETMALTAASIIIAGALFGLVGLAICVVALMWVMISVAFGF